MSLGPHAAFIWACYGAVALALSGLVVWLVADGRRLAREIAAIEARSARRRIDPPTPGPSSR
jgi:heme exporter protein D